MDTSISIYTAIYRDDVETLKWHLNRLGGYMDNFDILIFSAQCGSEKCFQYAHLQEIQPFRIMYPYLIRHAVNGNNAAIMDSLLTTRSIYVWDSAAIRAVVLGKDQIVSWILEKKLVPVKVIEDFQKRKEKIKVAAIEEDRDLHIHRPHIMREVWEMESMEYDQYIQWLPREVIDSIEDLWITSLCNSGQ